MSNAPAVLPSKRDRWLAARREFVTASDVAAILGEDPRRGPLAVYASKVGEFEVKETLPMRRGRRFESAIGEEYAEQTGREVSAVPEYELLHHPDIPWLAATLDRKVLATEEAPDPFGTFDVYKRPGEAWLTRVSRARAPLQIKMAIGSASHWKDDPPLGYAIQVTIEMACAGSTWGALCGLVGPGPLKTFDLPRNDAFLEVVYPKLEAFWLAVKRREPPEADGLPGTSAAIRQLWPTENGRTVGLGQDEQALVVKWEHERFASNSHKEAAEVFENKLRARLGPASFGALVDGSFLRLEKIKRAGYTVKPATYRALKRWWPKTKRR